MSMHPASPATEKPLQRDDRIPETVAEGQRMRIYQLLPRLFGNRNETRRLNGSLQENGTGKFADLTDHAIASLAALGCTHLWLTGVLQQATATDYSAYGEPADDPDLLKGLAGSPYAVRDCFDVCPDYAIDPAERLVEFRALLDRGHAAGIKTLIDFVPNHVARSYRSSRSEEPQLGENDDRQQFFHPQNNFFYLTPDAPGGGPPLRLPTVVDGLRVSPTCQVLRAGDGLFSGELDHGRVTGNSVVSWAPGLGDWYETVKLNYGFDFTRGTREFPHGRFPEKPIPDTWLKMDRVLAFWQSLGVDGFRCDMAHLIPPEFWNWAITRARLRNSAVCFLAEAYANDPAKVPSGDERFANTENGAGDVHVHLLEAGFHAVYDDPTYKTLKAIYDGSAWANDLDPREGADLVFHRSLRYAENHDEVRLAAKHHWGGLGPAVGVPVTALLFGLGRGPLLIYAGQELGETAEGATGFKGDDGRTTIFDYWSLPEVVKWNHDGKFDEEKLSVEQRKLRAFYARLWRVTDEPAFRNGEFFPLNSLNRDHPEFGREPEESIGGHWLYAYLRADRQSGQAWLAVTNLHPRRCYLALETRVGKAFSSDADFAGRFVSNPVEALAVQPGISATFMDDVLKIAQLEPLTPAFFELCQVR